MLCWIPFNFSHLLQEEASLRMAEEGTDLWAYQNIIRNHLTDFCLLCFIAIVLPIMFDSILGLWAIQSSIPGHLGKVTHELHLVVWASSYTSHWMATAGCLGHHCPRVSFRQDRLQVKGFVARLLSQSHHWKSWLVAASGSVSFITRNPYLGHPLNSRGFHLQLVFTSPLQMSPNSSCLSP